MDFLEEKLTYRSRYGEDATARRDTRQFETEQRLARKFFDEKNNPYVTVYTPGPESLAGILDTAGTIRVRVLSYPTRLTFESQVSLNTRHPGLVAGLRKKYPGSCSSSYTNGRSANPSHLWEARGAKSRQVLADINEYLLFRDEIGTAVLEFQINQERLKRSLKGVPKSEANSQEAVTARNEVRKKFFMDWVEAKIKAGEDQRIRHSLIS